jgi:hypothetical protein
MNAIDNCSDGGADFESGETSRPKICPQPLNRVGTPKSRVGSRVRVPRRSPCEVRAPRELGSYPAWGRGARG